MPTRPSPSDLHSGARSSSPPVTPTGEHGQRTQPGKVETLEAEPEPLAPPCYVTTARSGDACERRPISTAGQLQAEISALAFRSPRDAAPGPAVLTAARGGQTESANGVSRPLITIRGLPGVLVSVLLDSPLDIDPAFVEAHAAGTSYRPLGPRRRRGPRAARHAHWDYPELVAGHRQAVADDKSKRGFENRPVAIKSPEADLARRPVVRPVVDTHGALAVVFCRASLWASRDVDVLFLEKPCWGDDGPLKKARRVGRLAGSKMLLGQGLESNRDDWKGHEFPSLENILQESLAATRDSTVFQVLEEIAHEQWLGLFEVLTPREKVDRPGEIPLEWRILQCLERNIDMARSTSRSRARNGNEDLEGFWARPDDWGALMQRLQLRVEIFAAKSPRATRKKPGEAFQQSRAYIPHRNRPDADTPSSPGSDANQRALDRVTYLGGILLPFSIVSGVLSMNESFEPGRPLFWVFWVATIPLALFTVLVIYADNLRQVEVWAEILDPTSSASEEHDDDDERSTNSGGGDRAQETEKEKWKTAPAFGIYSAGDDVVIDLGNPSAELQQTSAESPLPHRQDRRRDSGQDQEGTSSDEDTADEVGLPIAAGGSNHRPGWKKKQLGWKGAAMCILRIQKPLWALGETPAAARE